MMSIQERQQLEAILAGYNARLAKLEVALLKKPAPKKEEMKPAKNTGAA